MSSSTLSAASLNDLTAAESRALELLGQGVYPEQAAAASGLTSSRISQLLSQEAFAAAVAERRYENLSKHNARDNAYDELEDTLVNKMKDCIPLVSKWFQVLFTPFLRVLFTFPSQYLFTIGRPRVFKYSQLTDSEPVP